MYQKKKNVIVFLLMLGIASMSLNSLIAVPLIGRQIIITKPDNRPAHQQAAHPINIKVMTVTEEDAESSIYQSIRGNIAGTPDAPTIIPALTRDQYEGINAIAIQAEYTIPEYKAGDRSKDLLIISEDDNIRVSPWTPKQGSQDWRIFQRINVMHGVAPDQVRIDIVID